MNLFYIDIEYFKNKPANDILKTYVDRDLKTEKRFYEYTVGRYLVKNIANKVFNVKETEIIYDENSKPEFKNSTLNFSISHTKNIVMACFDKYTCGIDIEYMKDRNLRALSAYFKKEFKNLDEFYKYWTLQEAMYKLNDKIVKTYSMKFQMYYVTIISSHNFNEKTVKIQNANTILNIL